MPTQPFSRYLLAQAYNNAWADHRLLRACGALTQAEFEATGRTSFFPGIRHTLNHNLTVQRFYLDALWRDWHGEPPHPDYQSFFEPEQPYATCTALWQAQRESNDSLIAYCAGLSDDELDRQVVIDRGDELQIDTRQRLLAHLFQHQIHHRGQVHAMLAGTSVAPPQLDEFYSSGEADLRARDFAELGWTEEQVWGEQMP
ncbi:DinB family protein [Pseudoduganella albidiflava]|uniref:Damage-inducible protein DinB n=1 Tax=Pseudoduganella albidiflava TaxID=321983 RepID=A0A411X0P7_9BURK|nr:DinB family protein [Pseudoduganella albidiflava]QBI02435.1 damage-inducible protein DinB [Pseudoduganella albidiflava]GGY42863.1 damage-inducible protein DinB [Pseudoduganella albidiflava]